jgi:hypothetical protein
MTVIKPEPRPCNGCGAEPGERHRDWDDIARCRSTGWQLIQCEGTLHEFEGRKYGEHAGPCGPDIWDGAFPGVTECHELGLFTNANSIWGATEDLNEMTRMAAQGVLVWDTETEKWVKN